ncbi:hypothetical protein OJ253_2804 [Cryptosporidium canis]|uniref:Uncharacterized protein n=1 Tax=Cryptosporidium canis TaxID=195482 RepID=A0A9D5DEU4_9CRYT|nr:hypothetical protein OJ253_2804 [Cryptosporidium canis]
MSILIVFDISFDSENSVLRLGYAKETLKRLFLDEEFSRDHSECLISVYFVLGERKGLDFVSPSYKEITWHPVGCCSSMELLVFLDKLIDKVARNNGDVLPENDSVQIKQDLDNNNNRSFLVPISDCFSKFLNDGVITERLDLDGGSGINTRDVSEEDHTNWTQEHQNIGMERQLLVIWLMDHLVYLKRLDDGGFPRFQDLNESCLIPNVEIKYTLLIHEGDNEKLLISNNFHSMAHVNSVSLYPSFSADKTLKNYICREIKNFFYSDSYSITFSAGSSPSELEQFNDLSVISFHLYPSLTKFPLVVQETLQILTFPPSSTFVGVVSIAMFQPLTVISRRLVQLINYSKGKETAVQALILALHKGKFAMVIELSYNWFALLISVTLGSNLHLAIDILPPGCIVAN